MISFTLLFFFIFFIFYFYLFIYFWIPRHCLCWYGHHDHLFVCWIWLLVTLLCFSRILRFFVFLSVSSLTHSWVWYLVNTCMFPCLSHLFMAHWFWNMKPGSLGSFHFYIFMLCFGCLSWSLILIYEERDGNLCWEKISWTFSLSLSSILWVVGVRAVGGISKPLSAKPVTRVLLAELLGQYLVSCWVVIRDKEAWH